MIKALMGKCRVAIAICKVGASKVTDELLDVQLTPLQGDAVAGRT
jgi:hypothetical protein